LKISDGFEAWEKTRTSAARAGGIANYFREEQMRRLAQQHKVGREMLHILAAITDKDGNFLQKSDQVWVHLHGSAS
jgi:hypothetical protein